ncbi:MAG: peptide deformylase [Deltaproteobacteria bacterium]|nr:peptide deformylase [Deltaproteobacteria bacterium]
MLEIVKYPDERLRNKTEPVGVVDDDTRRIVDEMAEIMYSAPGIGLAANQVGVLKRIAVIDVEYTDGDPSLIVLINPEIVERQGEIIWEEGCLSFPDVTEEITRFESVRVRALNRIGNTFEVEADGLLAIALQHEIDHLDGVLLIDHLSFLKRKIIHRQLSKQKRAG